MRILLSCPVSSHKEPVLTEWINYIQTMTSIHDVDILLVDNSPDKKHHKRWKSSTVRALYHKPSRTESINESIYRCWQQIRLATISGKYDYHFSLECDVFPPLNIIDHLVTHSTVRDLQVVGCTYFIGEGKGSRLCIQEMKQFGIYADFTVCHPTRSSSIMDGQLHQVHGIGQGCVLIRSDVYDGIHYRWEPGQGVSPDSFFYLDLYDADIPVWCDTSTIPIHKNLIT